MVEEYIYALKYFWICEIAFRKILWKIREIFFLNFQKIRERDSSLKQFLHHIKNSAGLVEN